MSMLTDVAMLIYLAFLVLLVILALLVCIILGMSQMLKIRIPEIYGAVTLDTFTFDKVVGKCPLTLVKFDRLSATVEKQDQFNQVAKFGSTMPDLLVAKVDIEDYGDLKNSKIATKYGVKEKDLPHIKLFVRGLDQPLTYGSNINANKIKQFIEKNSGLYISLSSNLEEFDGCTSSFTKGDKEKIAENLKHAEKAAPGLTDEEQCKSADTYIKLVSKIQEQGYGIVQKEYEMVDTLQNRTISQEKKTTKMQHKPNISLRFHVSDKLKRFMKVCK